MRASTLADSHRVGDNTMTSKWNQALIHCQYGLLHKDWVSTAKGKFRFAQM